MINEMKPFEPQKVNRFLIEFNSRITFKNVSFSFSQNEKIFDKLNFVIKRGEKIGDI